MKLVGGILIGRLCKIIVGRAKGCMKRILGLKRVKTCKCYERKKCCTRGVGRRRREQRGNNSIMDAWQRRDWERGYKNHARRWNDYLGGV